MLKDIHHFATFTVVVFNRTFNEACLRNFQIFTGKIYFFLTGKDEKLQNEQHGAVKEPNMGGEILL